MGAQPEALQEHWVPPNKWTWAGRVRAVRKSLGLRVEAMAELAGVNAKTWSTWENGTVPQAMNTIVRQIAERTGVNAEWLLWGERATYVDSETEPTWSLLSNPILQLPLEYLDLPALEAAERHLSSVT